MNTLDYNLKKLIGAGLIEKTSSFFWSVKGKKIPTYRLANKKIIISTKNSFKPLVLSAVIGGFILGAVKLGINYSANERFTSTSQLNDVVSQATPALMTKASETIVYIPSSIWTSVSLFALIGVFIGLAGYFLFKKMKGGKNN